MAVTGAATSARAATRQRLDLKWSLILRVVAVALGCFLVAAVLALYGTYRELLRSNEARADLLVSQLRAHPGRVESHFELQAPFPDWDQVVQRVQTAGQCIQYIKPDGNLGRSDCVGTNLGGDAPPAWFSSLSRWLLGTHPVTTRPLLYLGKTYGTLRVTTDTEVILAAIWKHVSGLLRLTALVVGAICLLQYVAISRALRPAKDILLGLDRLAHGAFALSSFNASARSSTSSPQVSTKPCASAPNWPPGSWRDRSRNVGIWRANFTTSWRRP